MNKNNSLQNQMVEAHSLIQQGRDDEAMTILSSLLRHLPRNPDVSHLMALAYKGAGDLEQATNYFYKSLALNSQQPQVYNNLANLQKANSDFKAAEENYFKAIAMQAEYLEAHRNLALCYATQGLHAKAVSAASRALSIRANDVVSLLVIANGYRDLGQFEIAFDIYQRASRLEPQNFSIWHNLGVLHHLQHELEQARSCYQKSYKLSPSSPQVVQSLALVSNELGLSDEAIGIFNIYLERHADDIEMHRRFNEMLWETDSKSLFGESYKRAIRRIPQSRELRTNYISQLFKSGQLVAARDALVDAVNTLGYSSQLLSLEGEVLAELEQYEVASNSLMRSLEYEFSQHTAQQLVKLNIVQADYVSAQEWLDELMSRYPECQLNWAYQSLIWRLTGDQRYSWLMDYQQFVRLYKLQTPTGYSNLDDFLTSLESTLNSLHQMTHAPLEQTLRHGTQTSARLLHNSLPDCMALKSELSKIVKQYIGELPDDLSHPLLSRKSEAFEFSGSWSVKLKSGGFHVNHVHPQGWISSSCYVSIPQGMQDGTDQREGQIKFGESPLNLGDRECIEKIVKPEAGLVVLFPSYCWHGTIPFSGNDQDYRMTAPFDVVPI